MENYSEDVLLYVGITGMGMERRAYYHAREHGWWRREVTRTSVTWYRTRSDAFTAETIAIWEEKPVYNIKRPKGPMWLPPKSKWDDADWFTPSECRCREVGPAQCPCIESAA